MGKQKVFHVLVKHPNTAWRLASQHYSKASAEKQAKKWTDAPWFNREGHKIKVVQVKRRTMGLARMSSSGRVLGYSSPYDRVRKRGSAATKFILGR